MSVASKFTGPRKSFMRQFSEAWHQEHGFFIDSCCRFPAHLTVRTPCGEKASTCLGSHKGEVLKLKDDIVTLLKGLAVPNGVVTRGRAKMLQLCSDNSNDLPVMLACLRIVLFYCAFDVGTHNHTIECIHIVTRSHGVYTLGLGHVSPEEPVLHF